ncbi:PBS lyase [Candidatus Magnetomoraceae bacterium gMMP-15]
MKHPKPSMGFFTTDIDLKIHSWDNWMTNATKLSSIDVCGKNLSELFPDLIKRGIIKYFQRVLAQGVVEVLAPAFHNYVIPCTPKKPSERFSNMQQKVTIAPLREKNKITGTIVTIDDVTERLEYEQDFAEQLASENETTRLNAIKMLDPDKAIPIDPLISVLDDENWRVRRLAIDTLIREDHPRSIKKLLLLLKAEHNNPSILHSALQVLTMSNIDIVTPLTSFLSDPDSDLRIYAALALGQHGDHRAIKPLIKALKDEDTNVQYHAIEALGMLKATKATQDLVALAESKDFFLAFPALEALKKIGDLHIEPNIISMLKDDMLTIPAVETLGAIGSEDAVIPLIKVLNQSGEPSCVSAQSLAAIYKRYEMHYKEGSYISDLASQNITEIALKNLINCMNEACPDELPALVLVLGWMKGKIVEQALTTLLGEEGVRKEVVEALVRCGNRVTDLLIAQLNGKNFEASEAAIVALGRIGNSDAVPALKKILKTAPDLKIVAINALAKIGDSGAYEELISLLGDPHPGVRQAAVAAINSIAHPEMPQRARILLRDPNPFIRESTIKIAGYFSYKKCEDLIIQACHDSDERVTCAALEHLPYLEVKSKIIVSTLIEAYKNIRPKIRAAAVRALGQVEFSESIISCLLKALDDPDSWVRYFAVRSIGWHGCAESSEKFAQIIKNDEASQVRIAAIEALAHTDKKLAVSILSLLTEEKDLNIAGTALKVLGFINHPTALQPLLKGIHSTNPNLQIEAIRALGRYGGIEAVEALQWIAVIAGKNEQVQKEAIDALARQATPEGIEALIEITIDSKKRELAIEGLSRLSVENLKYITVGLRHPSKEVRCSVIFALARMKNSQATNKICRALKDPDKSVRLTAISALKLLGSRRAKKNLAALSLTDPSKEVRLAAKAVLKS